MPENEVKTAHENPDGSELFTCRSPDISGSVHKPVDGNLHSPAALADVPQRRNCVQRILYQPRNRTDESGSDH